jgi:hypothetical protein
MKRCLNLVLSVFILAALGSPSFAQEEGTDTAGAYAPIAEAPAKPTPKKAAARKKTKKKKAPKPISEYKFISGEAATIYKFDKKANPILKAPKKKTAAGKKAAATRKEQNRPAAGPKTGKAAKIAGTVGEAALEIQKQMNENE